MISEPGDYHRIIDDVWCAKCARSNEHGIHDGVVDVHWFPEYLAAAPTPVLIHNFMQYFDNRVRLDSVGVKTNSSIRYWPDNSELLARLEDTA